MEAERAREMRCGEKKPRRGLVGMGRISGSAQMMRKKGKHQVEDGGHVSRGFPLTSLTNARWRSVEELYCDKGRDGSVEGRSQLEQLVLRPRH